MLELMTNLCTVPEVLKQVVALVLDASGDVIYFIVAPSNVHTTTYESSSVEYTVRIPTAEEVAQIEHEVQAWSYIVELIVGCVRSIFTIFTLIAIVMIGILSAIA